MTRKQIKEANELLMLACGYIRKKDHPDYNKVEKFDNGKCADYWTMPDSKAWEHKTAYWNKWYLPHEQYPLRFDTNEKYLFWAYWRLIQKAGIAPTIVPLGNEQFMVTGWLNDSYTGTLHEALYSAMVNLSKTLTK